MSRKGKIAKRDVLPDPVYNSKLVTRLINRVMYDGKRGTAQQIIYGSFKIIEERTKKPAIDVFATAINNIMPGVELKARRMGGANYQVPTEVSPERKQTLGLRWLVTFARLRNEKTMEEKLAAEAKAKAEAEAAAKAEAEAGEKAPEA